MHEHGSRAFPEISVFTAGMRRHDGFVPFYRDDAEGRILLEFADTAEPMLLVERVSRGLGEYPVERGQLGRPLIVNVRRAGRKLLLDAENLAWRTSSPDPAQRHAVRQSFPGSTIWAFPVVAAGEGSVLVDGTGFFLRDGYGVAGHMQDHGFGSYQPDPARSAMLCENCRAFPDNSSFEAAITFVNEKAQRLPFWNGNGRLDGIEALAPDPRSVTFGLRCDFIRLPDAGYTPRAFDPRSSFFSSVIFHDFNAGADSPIDVHWLLRHRLKKTIPGAAMCRPERPIVYYVDRGAPDGIREAILEGASWWNRAFEAAGFIDAFRVELLPADADPMDIRFNTITWAAKPRRGFAYGSMVWDPRTGEIIKGEVTLTALRDRHVRSMLEAMTAPFGGDDPRRRAAIEKAVSDRIRLLAAHETGHTLGLEHNHAAIPGGSVMDYPAPRLTLDDEGRVDVSNAYSQGLSPWDHVSIAYGYTEFEHGVSEKQELDAILDSAHERGLFYMGLRVSQPLGSAHPRSNYWSNGIDPVAELERVLDVRDAALKHFDEGVIRPGRPMATIEEMFVQVYAFHHLQLAAAAKSVGGVDYRYALRGDGQLVQQMVGPVAQRRALAAILSALSVDRLHIDPRIVRMMPPRPPEYPRGVGSFEGRSGQVFDPAGAVEATVNSTLHVLLDAGRISRLVQQKGYDPDLPDLMEVLERLVDATWKAPREDAERLTTALTIQRATLDTLLRLRADLAISKLAQACVKLVLQRLGERISAERCDAASDLEQAHHASALAAISEAQAGAASIVRFAPGQGPL